MQPLVSIIIPTYNRSHFLRETLDSVITQTYKNWECIVVDDGSTDYTPELMEFYCEMDSRIKYHHRPHDRPKGANACRNYGFELSNGEYIQWLDSDDLLGMDKIEKQIQVIKKPEDSVVFCFWVTYKNYLENDIQPHKIDNKVFSSFDFFENLRSFGGFLPPHCYLSSRNLVEKSGLWNEYLLINQDGDFFFRLICNINKIRFTGSIVYYRLKSSGDNLSLYNSKEKVADLIAIWNIIENLFYVRFKTTRSIYIEDAKKHIFNNIKDSYPDIILENEMFFKKQIKKNKFFSFLKINRIWLKFCSK